MIRCRFAAISLCCCGSFKWFSLWMEQSGVISPVEAGGTPTGLSPIAQRENKALQSHCRFITVQRKLGKHHLRWSSEAQTEAVEDTRTHSDIRGRRRETSSLRSPRHMEPVLPDNTGRKQSGVTEKTELLLLVQLMLM